MHKELFVGITAAVSTGLISSANSIADAAKKAANVSGGYSAANAGFAGLKAYDAIKNLQGMANGTGNIASASIGVGFEYSKTKENAESSVPVVTDIRGGNSVSIEAKSGDINSHGAQIIAGYALSNPQAGRPLPTAMTDPRWPAAQGWIKMAQNVNGIEIYYVRNTKTGQIDDFKFK